MQRSDHWNDQNTTALIQGISGLAGNIINAKAQGKQLTAQEQQLALLAQQTAAALGNANTQNLPPQTGNLGMSQTTLMIGGGVALLIIGFLLFKYR